MAASLPPDELARLRPALRAIGTIADPDIALENADLKALLTYWNSKRAGREMPTRDDIDPLDLGYVLANILMVDVQHQPLRFRWRLIGTEITAVLGRDRTGRWFDEVYEGATLDGFNAALELSVRTRRPMRFVGDGDFAQRDYLAYESIQLPLSDDGELVNIVMIAAKYGSRAP